jgi:uncharacterized damage-inducible protein DinB
MTNTAINILNQLKDLLIKFDTNEYKKELKILNGSSIGQHTRHIIEFFLCLIDQAPSGTVNYDLRVRNMDIENDNSVAVKEIEKIISSINQLSSAATPIDLVTSEGFDSPQTMTSSLGREIWYNVEHAIHHMAIIRMTLSHQFPTLEVKKEFGVAISTLKYRAEMSTEN